jgi:hypothetical protein
VTEADRTYLKVIAILLQAGMYAEPPASYRARDLRWSMPSRPWGVAFEKAAA